MAAWQWRLDLPTEGTNYLNSPYPYPTLEGGGELGVSHARPRRGRGKPLVLLHCLGMDWHFWDVLEPLADQFELIAYSFPGHHDTRLPKGQYDEAGLSQQLKYPEMLDRVILCDCAPPATTMRCAPIGR